ncbi:hypothetical protein ACFOLJ_21205 [Rugamonas sp. CCM 8940]|uniref:hypothetical protein n=1 Tax=Rugamonas sp. CCM 8940 TaxID=2765359 RepID=UPI0018F43EFC|nr:hypothetical protein [Rugamonas sp. CCM 8940]MBJ7312660.1 hypothetical protein [Rugamonas sp. CCM 8940]
MYPTPAALATPTASGAAAPARRRAALLGLALAAALFGAAGAAPAASNMVPDYEVKLLLNPTVVLDSNYKLNATVLSTFGMPSSVTKMNVMFMDGDAKPIYNNGWIARVRKSEGDSGFELSYKKRYPIANGNITEALYQASADGFTSGDSNYEAQIEWGYQAKTLSITNSKTDSKSGYSGMDLPSTADARSLLKKNIPGKMNNWLSNGWGGNALDTSRKYGPVLAKRSVGSWSGLKLYIEVWPIRNAAGSGIDYVVEASFKTTSESVASAKHDELQAFLAARGWFLAQDSLKTQLIMDRY